MSTKYQMWLTYNAEKEKIQLPVLPESFEVNNGSNNESILQIDRYKAAVGGTQGLDMNFNYHISVLKSPLPFKAGVNITGNLDKMKIRIGKAKYKDAVTPVEIRKVDSTRVNMGQEIIHSFERVISRTYRGKLPQGAE